MARNRLRSTASSLARRIAATALGPAEQRPDRRHEDGRLDRLEQVAVSRVLEGGHPAVLARRRREVQHRELAVVGLGADPAADLEAVEVGQVHVEDDEVDVLGGDHVEGGGAVARLDRLEPGPPQVPGDEVAVGLQVVDDEDPRRRRQDDGGVAHRLGPSLGGPPSGAR